MRTMETTVYTFDELNDTAKEKARDWYRDGALGDDWWDDLYEDAVTIGLNITSFDLDHNRHGDGHLTMSLPDSCKTILKEHGEACETYKTASDYLTQYNRLDNAKDEMLRGDIEEGRDADIQDQFEQDLEELTEAYQQSLLEDYSIMLQHEYEWLLSDEQVDESIRCNGYEFTESGKRA